jgi:hypothetical protein
VVDVALADEYGLDRSMRCVLMCYDARVLLKFFLRAISGRFPGDFTVLPDSLEKCAGKFLSPSPDRI